MVHNFYKNQKFLVSEFGLFKLALVIVDIVVWGYYSILLYSQTGNLVTLLYEYIIYLLALYVGFLIMTFYQDRLGYLYAFRLSSFLQTVVLFLLLLNLNRVGELFILFALLRGLARGSYWPIEHSFSLKEIHGRFRGEVFSLVQSISQLLKIVLPIMAGAIISYSGDYSYIFLLGILTYSFAGLYPFKYNKRTQSKIRASEITRILKIKGINKLLFTYILLGGFRSLMIMSFLIVPYLLIGNEFGVGALMTLAGVISAVLGILDRNQSLRIKTIFGSLAFGIYFCTTFTLSLFWSIPVLIFRQGGTSFADVIGVPARDDIDFRIREKILGDFKNESALEMNLIAETCFIIGRIVIFTIFILLLDNMKDNQESLLRVAISIGSFGIMAAYFYILKLFKEFKIV